MGDEDKIETMYKAFKNWVGPLPTDQRYPHFDKEQHAKNR